MVRNGHLTLPRSAVAIALLCSAGVGLTLSAPAYAAKVGVAAAVNPDAFSSLSNVPNKQLNIGKSIFYNERIETTAQGLVQVLLVDGSTFTVGPNSNLVIDKFVYDPNKKTGELVATFSKGSMRFIGGKLSKNAGGVKVNTPDGALAIRGGMFQGNTQKKIYSFLFGHSMTLQGRNGKTQTVYQPGYTLDMSSGRGTVRPTTAEDTAVFMQALSSPATSTTSGNGGGNSGSQNPNSIAQQSGQQADNVANGASQAVGDATATQIQTEIVKQLIRLEEQVTKPTLMQTQTPTNKPAPEPEPEPEPEPVKVELRVLTPPSNYTAYGQPVRDPEDRGILGGDDNDQVTADDFIWTFTIEDGRLVGSVTGLTGGIPGDPESTEQLGPAQVDFPAVFPLSDCNAGVCAVRDAKVTHAGQTKTYLGLAVLQQDFYAYHITDPEADLGQELAIVNELDVYQDEVGYQDDDGGPPQTLLAFGGKGHDFGTPSGRTFAFLLTQDVTNNAFAPFAGDGSAPTVDTSQDENGDYINPQPFVTPLLFKEQTDGTPESEAVWLQTSLYIKTTPVDEDDDVSFDQQSFINVALGGIDAETGGLVGERRGGSELSQHEDSEVELSERQGSYTYTGDIASLSGPDGSHFLGTENPNVVIGLDSAGESHNIGRDVPNDTYDEGVEVGSTTHIGLGIGPIVDQDQSYDGIFQGYASGMVTSDIPSGDFTNEVASLEPEDFQIGFDRRANTMWANLRVYDLGGEDVVDSYQVSFGDLGDQDATGRSAYIDDLHYGAIEDAAVVEGFEYAKATGYLVSGDQLGVTQFFPETFTHVVENADGSTHRPFCQNCDFIRWGAWGAKVAFGNDSEEPSYVDNVHLGWWVMGNMTDIASLDALAASGAEATYAGNAIGSVANRIGRETWSHYTAAGKLDMDWNFASRTGNFEISKFDKANFPSTNGLNFTGQMIAPGKFAQTPGNYAANRFSGNIAGNLPGNLGIVDGQARGSFVNSPNTVARGVIGNWNVGNATNYKATGIFAGSGIPGAPK